MRVGWALALLLAVSLSFADNGDLEVSLPSLGIGFLLVIALVSVGLVALSSAVGSALQSPGIIAWSKEQFRETFAAVILVVLIWGFVTGSNTLIGAIFFQEGITDLPGLGEAALDGHLEDMEGLYLKVADAYQTVGIYQGFSYFASVGGFWIYFGQGGSPYFGASALLPSLSTAANNLTTQILTFRLLKVFMVYIGEAVPEFLLPIALAFRIFPFTRKMGNTLIALCLGAILVLPLSLMFVDEFGNAVNWNYKDDALGTAFTYDQMELDSKTVQAVMATADVLCESISFRVFMNLGELVFAPIYAAAACAASTLAFAACFAVQFELAWYTIWPLISMLGQTFVGSIILAIFQSDLAAGTAGEGSVGLKSIASILLPGVAETTGFSLISLLIIAMVTFSGTKSISAALGGEYVLYGISRFV
ncbi:MAG: hypothetical protein ACLFUZ_02000 [Candidatus Micrarchaeia archaeon]